MNPKVKKGINIVLTILVVIIFIVGVFMVALSFSSLNEDVPSAFGVMPIDILTDSMEGTINPGDLAIVVKTDVASLKVGDIITFKTIIEGQWQLNTHKIVEINQETMMFTTRGTNPKITENDTPFDASWIIGKYTGRIPKFGFVLRFLKSGLGFGLIIVLPLAVFFFFRLVVLIKVVLDMKKDKNKTSDPDYQKLLQQVAELQAKLGDEDKNLNNDESIVIEKSSKK